MDINLIINKMGSNNFLNKRRFIKCFGDLNYIDALGNSLLHLVANSLIIDTNKLETASELLLENKVNPNIKNKDGNTFIHVLFNNNYNICSILPLISKAIKYGFDINSVNNYGYTIFHMAIEKYSYSDTYLLLLMLLECNFNFNSNTNDKMNIFKFINDSSYNVSEKEKITNKIINCFNTNNKILNNPNILDNYTSSLKEDTNNKDDSYIKKTCLVLTDKFFDDSPAIDRDEYIDELIISLAQSKKMPIVVGPSGCGKTAIIDELAYRIQNKRVPSFLIDKKILEMPVNNIIANAVYRGEFEENMRLICDYCIKKNIILFIDEIHLIYGTGKGHDSQIDMASIIREYIDRRGLKVIGTTTDLEYETYFANSPIKRRFDVIKVSEPDRNTLYNIIYNCLINYGKNLNISINPIKDNLDLIINSLIELTDSSHRNYLDSICNPDLVISIIDKAFAYARVFENDELLVDYIVKSINSSTRIYDSAKNKIIDNIMELNNTVTLKRTKIININNYKK